MLISFVAFARSSTPLKKGNAIAARIATIAMTMSNSIKVKQRSKFFVTVRQVKSFDDLAKGKMRLRRGRLLDKVFASLRM